jgi:hypothetical protein
LNLYQWNANFQQKKNHWTVNGAHSEDKLNAIVNGKFKVSACNQARQNWDSRSNTYKESAEVLE